MPLVVLRSADGATAEVHPHGAHVTSWRPAPGGDERLFLSARSRFGHGAAIRGGIPVIFPQFSQEGPLPRHGFARTMEWTHAGTSRLGRNECATFVLASSEVTRAIWPAEFRATLSVRVGGNALTTSLTVENHGGPAFTFHAALHTYLRVADVAQTELVGLRGTRYRESTNPSNLIVDSAERLRITGEIDRVYVNAGDHLVLREPHRQLVIESANFPDVVVWNPGAARAAALDDMEPGGERHMLCVEAAAVQVPVTMPPHSTWAGSQTLHAEDRP